LKPLHLNLASRPYRDYVPVYAVAATLAVLSAILLVNNGLTAYRYLVNTKETRAEIARVQTETSEEQRAAEKLEGSLARIDLKSLNAEVRFINTQIADRAFSWSTLLDTLEKVLPRDVRLISLDPTIDKEGDVVLNVSASSKASGGMVQFLKALNSDPHFQQPLPRSQNRNDDGSFTFALSMVYRPDLRMELMP